MHAVVILRTESHVQHQNLLLYCMEPSCVEWATATERDARIAAVIGWHPSFDYWVPTECAPVCVLRREWYPLLMYIFMVVCAGARLGVCTR